MLNKDELLKRTNNGLDVFKYYIDIPFKIGRNFLNPLYNDNKASCNVYFDRKNGIYRIKDFGNDEYSGDCFFFVGKLKGLDCGKGNNFIEILKTINYDMSLGLDNSSSTVQTNNHRASQNEVIQYYTATFHSKRVRFLGTIRYHYQYTEAI